MKNIKNILRELEIIEGNLKNRMLNSTWQNEFNKSSLIVFVKTWKKILEMFRENVEIAKMKMWGWRGAYGVYLKAKYLSKNPKTHGPYSS